MGRVRLEPPSARRERDFIDAALRSRALHRGLVTAPATTTEYREYLARTRRDDRAAFFVVANTSGALAGVVGINDIVRGSRDFGRLGYYAFTPYAGTGMMRQGLVLAIDSAFREFELDRIEANVQPSNRRSIALLTALGFAREGTERAYKVGTRWRNHERWALVCSRA